MRVRGGNITGCGSSERGGLKGEVVATTKKLWAESL